MTETQKVSLGTTIRTKYYALKPALNERSRRVWAATEAKALGYGGQTIVHLATGIDYKTIAAGTAEIDRPQSAAPAGAIRRIGGGCKKRLDTDPTLETDLEDLLDPKGDPMSLVRWTTKSLSHLESALRAAGHQVSYRTIGTILKDKKFSLQANKKNIEGISHPDRDGQFQLINATVKDFLTTGDPVISVDTKKKELLGNFKNNGREWTPKGSSQSVNVYDFGEKDAQGKVKKAVPYGVYDILHNAGFVNVGTSADTAAFSVASIRRWWQDHGRRLYPQSKEVLITCDGGGSNSSRSRLWKKELQGLADETDLTFVVRHYPPATSKWDKIEHNLFSYISMNWRSKPLTSLETVIELISHTTTEQGLTITAVADTNTYEKGLKVTDEELAALNIERCEFHGEWNYMIRPQGRVA